MSTVKVSKLPFEFTKKIHVLKNQAKLTDDEYRDLLEEWTDKRSSKLLRVSEAISVIENLEAMIKLIETKQTMKLMTNKNKFVQKPGGLTQAQYGCIKGKQKELGYTDDRLDGFINHTIGKYTAVEDLTLKEASMVISGLMQMKKERKP